MYLDNEVTSNAMYGHFIEKPINMHISPLMTREKPSSGNRRTIALLDFFLNRMLHFLRDTHMNSRIQLTEEFVKGLN